MGNRDLLGEFIAGDFSPELLKLLILEHKNLDSERLFEAARKIREQIYGKDVYVRGLIEFSNICKNDCYYCGIRKSNQNVDRYRLTKEDILLCCEEGFDLGFRTFVLQSGEDSYFTKERLGDIITSIKTRFPECAITLSVGERSYEDYKYWFECGADRYLLRHETANDEHYQKLHPANLSLAHRKECLYQLKEIGYQIGAGFMVGSPYQTADHLVEDLLFLKELQPHMIGIGPFIPHKDTDFRDETAGTLEETLFLLGMIRIMMPHVLLPATTALGTIHPRGRELGILAGANVVMPNLSPTNVRKKYLLYDNKICTGDESAQCRSCLERRMESVGYHIVQNRGDYKY
jgi:biotin synthase